MRVGFGPLVLFRTPAESASERLDQYVFQRQCGDRGRVTAAADNAHPALDARLRQGPAPGSQLFHLLPHCSLPLTGAGCINKVLTDLAYLEIKDGAFWLKERAPGVSVEEIRAKTAGELVIPDPVPEMVF